MKKEDFKKGERYFIARYNTWAKFLYFSELIDTLGSISAPVLIAENYKGLKDYKITTYMKDVFISDGKSEGFLL